MGAVLLLLLVAFSFWRRDWVPVALAGVLDWTLVLVWCTNFAATHRRSGEESQFTLLMLFLLHGAACFIAAYWSYQVMESRYSEATRVEVDETGRVLLAVWIFVGMFGIAELLGVRNAQSDGVASTVQAALGFGSVATVYGPGLSRWRRARQDAATQV